jgi:uncharacterized membrane protein YkoI
MRLLLIALLLLGGELATAANAEGSRDRAYDERGQVSLDEAIEMAQRRFNARVVRSEVAQQDRRRVYVLRMLSEDGRVFVVRIDAASGGILD